jgi:hypothetical protein
MAPMQLHPQHNINRQQTIIAQPRPIQPNQIIPPNHGQRPPTIIYPNITTPVQPTTTTGILKNGIQQPFVQTPQPIMLSGFGILGPKVMPSVINPPIQSNIPIQPPIQISPTIPVVI